MKTQLQMFYEEQRKIGDRCELMLDMIRNGEITNDELAALIKRRPERYGMFEGFVGKLKEVAS